MKPTPPDLDHYRARWARNEQYNAGRSTGTLDRLLAVAVFVVCLWLVFA